MALAIRTWWKDRETSRARERSRRRAIAIAVIALLGSLALGQSGALAVKAGMPSALGGGMSVGSITSQPIGHYEFCRRLPAECALRSDRAAPGALTTAGWVALMEVNEAINRAVTPRTDMELHGLSELWSFPGEAGDCEDYVLAKRAELLRRGFVAGDLLITVVRRANGEGHAVLTVRTDRGDFVLDNLVDDVRDWRETPYRYLKRQASTHAGRWVDITNGETPVAVGSVE